MKRGRLLLYLGSLLLIPSPKRAAEDLYIIPNLQLRRETLVVEWKTPSPGRGARVYLREETERNLVARLMDFPTVVREKKKGESRDHRIVISGIEPGKVYLLRLAVEDPFWVEIKYSRLYRFKASIRDGEWVDGVVFDLGPFLGFTDNSTYIVAWTTNRPAKGEVFLWKGGQKKLRYPAPMRALRQEVVLDKLEPGEEYHYQVYLYDDDTTESQVFTFRTMRKNVPLRIAALGDCRANYRQPSDMAAVNGVNEETLRNLLYRIFEERPDLIFITGDLIQGYTDDTLFAKVQFESFLQASWPVSASIPILPVVGNHDATAPLSVKERRTKLPFPTPNSPEDLWRRFYVVPLNGPQAPPGQPPYIENVYYLAQKDALFIVLNSDYWYRTVDGEKLSQRVDEIQRNWLRQVLKREKAKWTFIFIHEPAYPISRHFGSSLDLHPASRDSLWETLVQGGVDVFVAGHEHLYARVLVDEKIDPRWKRPIWQFITGRAGAPLYRKKESLPYSEEIKAYSILEHYIIFEIRESEIYFETKALTGEIIDQGSIEHSP